MTAKKRSLRGLSSRELGSRDHGVGVLLQYLARLTALLPPYMQARELAAWTLDQVHTHRKRFEVHGRGWCSYCILGHS